MHCATHIPIQGKIVNKIQSQREGQFEIPHFRCQTYMDKLVENHGDIVTRETLGKSIQGRKLDMVTITDPVVEGGTITDKEGREVKKRTVLVMARSHPGESPASFVVQGLMDFLVSKHKVAQELREKLIFKVIPMMNPDGVYLGNYRGNLLGKLRHNRCIMII